jgi:uncharacterized coiled-coil DUF342 family protein
MIVAELELDVTATGAQEAQDQLLQIQNVAQDVADTAINLDINTDDIRTELVDTIGGQDVAVRVIADTDDAVEEIRDLGEVSLEDLGIEVDADTAPARAALQNLHSEKITVDADTAPASRALADVQRDISRLSNAKGMIHLDTQSLALAQRDVQRLVDSGEDMRSATSDWATAFVQAGRESEDSLEDLEAYYQQVRREVSQGIDIQVDTHEVETAGTELEKFPDATKKLGDSAKQNFKEMAGNFTGNVSQMGDATQQFVSESLMGLGPAGIAAGIAAAAGIGLIRGKLDEIKENAKQTSHDVAGITDSLLGLDDGASAVDLVNDKLREFATTAGEDGKSVLQNLKDDANSTGIAWEQYARGMAGGSEEIAASLDAIKAKRDELSAQQDAHVRQYGTMDGAIQSQINELDDQRDGLIHVAQEQRDGADSATLYQEATEGTSDASRDATDALKDQLDALQQLQGVQIDASEAQVRFQQAIADASAAITENGQTTDLTTEAGRKNVSALDDVAESGMRVVTAMQQAGGSTADLQTAMQTARDAYTQAAEAAGYSSDEAAHLADRMHLIPSEVSTDISAQDHASSVAKDVKNALDDVPPEKTVTIWTELGDWWSRTWRSMASAQDSVPHHADGGPITGPGGPTDDDVLIAASNGEHMIPADEVRMAGGQTGVFALRSALRAGTLTYPGGPTTATTSASASTAVVGPSALAGALDGVRMTLDVDGREIDGVIRATARDEALDVAQMGAM